MESGSSGVRGPLTFLMSDIEGSTRLWEAEPVAMRDALEVHDRLVDEAVAECGGQRLKERGEGDSTFSVFEDSAAAVRCAIAIQSCFARQSWPTSRPLRVRIGVHCGEAEARLNDFYGPTVNRCARIRAAASGGQILISDAIFAAIKDSPFPGCTLIDHGLHRLADLTDSERLTELRLSGANGEFPPLATLNRFDHNLPVQLTTFVGREQVLADIKGMLADHRLVTLTGAGGSGKTRLALQVAAEPAPNDNLFVRFFAFSSAPRGADLSPHVLRQSGIGRAGDGECLDPLVQAVHDRRALFIFDNCEHVLDSAASIARELLQRCPDLRILATAREPLALSGEACYLVPTMTCPVPRAESAEAIRTEAMTLFLDRVRSRRPDFVLDEEATVLASELCRLVDGIPLALEQAAGRVPSLGLPEVVRQLGESLDVLKSAFRDLEPRQQTVKATIEWSYNLLEGSERGLFEDVSVFTDAFTLEDVQQVCLPGAERSQAAGQLEVLIEKSLVQVHLGPGATPAYRLLRTIREVAASHGQERMAELRRRHAAWFVEKAATLDSQMNGPEHARASAQFSTGYGNFLSAADVAATGAGRGALPLVYSMRRYWFRHGPLEEAIRLTRQAIEAVDNPNDALVGEALNGLGAMLWSRGNLSEAREVYLRALEVLSLHGDSGKMAAVHNNLGVISASEGNNGEAAKQMTLAMNLYKSLKDEAGLAGTSFGLGRIAIDRGRPKQAIPLLRRAARLYLKNGMVAKIAQTYTNLADAYLSLGDHGAAAEWLGKAVDQCSDLEDRFAIIGCLGTLMELLGKVGVWEEAAYFLGVLENDWEESGAAPSEAQRLASEFALHGATKALGQETMSLCRSRGGSANSLESIAEARASLAQLSRRAISPGPIETRATAKRSSR